jgi:hypothetical protein
LKFEKKPKKTFKTVEILIFFIFLNFLIFSIFFFILNKKNHFNFKLIQQKNISKPLILTFLPERSQPPHLVDTPEASVLLRRAKLQRKLFASRILQETRHNTPPEHRSRPARVAAAKDQGGRAVPEKLN